LTVGETEGSLCRAAAFNPTVEENNVHFEINASRQTAPALGFARVSASPKS
jgi:hypothetical protein